MKQMVVNVEKIPALNSNKINNKSLKLKDFPKIDLHLNNKNK